MNDDWRNALRYSALRLLADPERRVRRETYGCDRLAAGLCMIGRHPKCGNRNVGFASD